MKKNVTCKFDDKKYVILYFTDVKRREETFSQLNDFNNLQKKLNAITQLILKSKIKFNLKMKINNKH